MVDQLTTPAMATIKGVELATVGFWDISNATDWHPSAEDLAAAVAAQECPAVRRACLKLGHTGVPGEGDPAIGLVDNMRLSDDGQTLIGDFVGVPAWFAEPDDEGRSVIASAYPDRSGEFSSGYRCQLGHEHPFVVSAVSLLGVVAPGIGTLESLFDLYAKAPQKEEPAMATTALASTTIDQVRKAYYNGPGVDWHLWIREMYVDPPELIVQNDADDTIERVPYEVSGEGEVAFGDPQPVKVEYVNARAAGEKPALACASRAEARPDAPAATTNPSATSVEAPQGKEGLVPDLNADLIKRLGLPEDADEAAILAAFDAKIADPAPAAPDVEAVTPELVAAAAKRHGLTVLDEGKYTELASDAASGREARAQQLREHRERVVDASIDKGKITPPRREHFLGLMEKDPEGTEAFLDGLPEQASVPLTPMGHSTEPQDTTAVTDNDIYNSWSL